MSVARFVAAALLGAVAFGSAARAEDAAKVTFGADGGLRVRGVALRRDTAASIDKGRGFTSGGRIHGDSSYFDTRLRLSLRATVLQEVTAKLGIEVGDITFGDGAGGLGTDGRVFENKNLYLEWHPTRYSFRIKAGLYGRQSDPYGIILSNDVAGVAARVELLGTGTELYVDFIKAEENSRIDLDSDTVLNNDYNDRTIVIAGVTTRFFEAISLEAFYVADLDNTNDTPSPGTPASPPTSPFPGSPAIPPNTEATTHWGGLSVRSRLGPVSLFGTGIFAYGRRSTAGQPGVIVRGYAFDTRVQLSIPFLTIEAIYAQASGDRASSATANERFPVITPWYGQSSIIYNNFGGFSATGSDLSGTGWVGLKLRAAPTDDLSVELLSLWAWYTADHNVAGNVNEFHKDARDLGLEFDLNLNYTIVDGFKAFARGAVMLPGRGYRVAFDTDRGGALLQLIVGAQLSF